MNARLGLTLLSLTLTSFTALGDDRAACKAGNQQACARIGQLKQQGALSPDGTKNVDALVTACGKALDAAKSPQSMSAVSRACNQLFNSDLQKSWSAIAGITMPGMEAMLGTGWAEAYCPKLSGKVKGCNGTRAANFSSMNAAAAREAVSALSRASLELELGKDKAGPLADQFDAAWKKLLGG